VSQVGGDKSSCCRDDLEGESGRVVRLQRHGHHCRVEGMIGGMGDDDEHRLNAQIIEGTGCSNHSSGSHHQHFQGGLFEIWCSGVYKMRSRSLANAFLHIKSECELQLKSLQIQIQITQISSN
jgi:hypothetical protein